VVVVAGSFAFADIVLIKALGLGIAIAVALDATVVRALLVPATMRLLGKWNWWLPEGLARRIKTLAAAALSIAVLGGCTGGPILANAPLVAHNPPSPSPAASRLPDPQPIVLPRDDGPHDRLTEWWYFTGHLDAADGRHLGFEAVIFRAERGAAPVTWASHLAVTDESGERFLYAQRTAIGPAPDRSPRDATGEPTGFDLAIAPPGTQDSAAPPETSSWRLSGSGDSATIDAGLTPTEATALGGSFELHLVVDSNKRPVLHDGNGWIDFGPAGGSYYYSRTRMFVTGSVSLDGGATPVTGEAWFDHQWGDFISVGAGGWDWFAVNLDDHTDLTLSLVRAADGSLPLVYGTFVDAEGTATHLDRDAFSVTSVGTWRSPATGATYPAGWTIEIPSRGLTVQLTPTIPDQELDTRATTGVVYWEGSQVVRATRGGEPLGGEAYVELTGYAP
jgi:predicted secreted hydrolase